jgi:hypothetical protein
VGLHFSDLKDNTKKNSAIYEFFIEDNYSKPLNINKVKGKSLARLIEERKVTSLYNKKRHLALQLKLLQILVILACALCISTIAYMLLRLS